MIRRELKSQLNDLEMRIAAAVQARRDKANAPLRHAFTHAMEVAAVALHGEPKIEEPLRIAQSRMQEKLEKEFAAVVEALSIREFGRKPDCWLRPYFHSLYAPSCLTVFLGTIIFSSLNEYSARRLPGS